MSISKRIIAVLICISMVVSILVIGKTQKDIQVKSVFDGKNSLVLWYTDDTLTDYLNAMAVAYHDEYGVRVLPRLQTGDDYLESINKASLEQGEVPDLYIISSETLEKAYLSGLASVIWDDQDAVSDQNFSKAALNAVTYKDHLTAYPYYFETSALLYNKTYLYDMAKNRVTAENADTGENDGEITEDTEEETKDVIDSNLSEEEQIQKKMEEYIPDTFDELLTFADEYDAPQAVEAVFKWDVCDIFFNYFFIGNYANVGGIHGDDESQIDIYHLDTIKAMQVYQNLNQFFSIDADDVAYDSVIQEFMEGKLVFTTATTGIISKLEEAKKNGDFAFDYGVAAIPDLNDELKSKSLSVTNSLVINGYSDKKEDANDFAKYLVCDQAGSLYEKTGKISANKNVVYDNQNITAFQNEYADSVPMPKMMATSNYWIQLEITFARVWRGTSVSSELKKLSELMLTQVSGKVVKHEYIEEPKEEEETVEYFDEEAEKEAAKQEE